MSKHSSRGHEKQAFGKKPERLSRYLALEPRVLLDAAALATADQIADQVQHVAEGRDTVAKDNALIKHLTSLYQDSQSTALAGSTSTAKELLFIDANIDGYEALIAGLGNGVEVHVLQGQDWSSQMQAVLDQRQGDVEAVHLVSHGSAGSLTVAGTNITSSNLDAYSVLWSSMKQALTSDGDLLIYGCDVAAGNAGATFVKALAEHTGADIAASSDLSGVAALGGDWELEVSSGVVTAHSLYADGKAGAAFESVLDAWVTDTGEVVVSGANTAGAKVASTKTSDNAEWKFVSEPSTATSGTAGSAAINTVIIFKRDASTGVWGLFGTVNNGSTSTWSGTGTAQFGADIAAAGDRLVVGSPGNNSVYVFSWNGTNWTTGVQTIAALTPTDGTNARSYTAGTDTFGSRVDIATDGSNYKLAISNPNEDFYGSASGTGSGNTDAGVVYVLNATGTGAFGTTTATGLVQLASKTTATGTDATSDLFGNALAISYDRGNGNWWVAVGNDANNTVMLYRNPTGQAWGVTGVASGDGLRYNTTTYAWNATTDSISMHDDYLAIGQTAAINIYKLDAAGQNWTQDTNATVSTPAGMNPIPYVVDLGVETSANNVSPNSGYIVYTYSSASTAANNIISIRTDASGSWVTQNVFTGTTTTPYQSVALDRWRGLDIVAARSASSQSWHYNRDPSSGVNNSTVSANISTPITLVVTDPDKAALYPFGDSLVITALGTSAYGAAVTYTGTTVTYDGSGSAVLKELAAGQSVTETLSFTVSDGQGGSTTSMLTITVNGVNDAPVASSINPLTPFAAQQSNSTISYDFSSYFTDIDSGDTAALIFEALILPSGWSAVVDGRLLKVTVPAGATAGNNTIKISAKDSGGLYSATRDFIINVDTVNNAPTVANPLPDQVAVANYAFRYEVPASAFGDADPAPYDTLTYTATLDSGSALPSWLTFDASTLTFQGTPTGAAALTVRVTVSDGRGGVTHDDFSLTVVDPAVKSVSQFTDGPSDNADFGFSVAISGNGNWMVVSSPGYNTATGAVFYYQLVSSTWTYRGSVAASDGATNDKFGWSLAIDDTGEHLVVGARGDDSGAGAVYTFTRASAGSTFSATGKIVAANRQVNDYFGTAVAINEGGNYILIGASYYDTNGITDAGAAFMTSFGVSTSVASPATISANVLAKDPQARDHFGTSVAFDQNILVVSAMDDDNPSGIVGSWSFDETTGTVAGDIINGNSGTLNTGAYFVYDAERGQVIKLDASVTTSGITLSSPVDLGDTWTISAWYNNISSNDPNWRTLTRGSSDHQIIVEAGSNKLGTYNNTGMGQGGFVGATTVDQQLLAISGSSNFTLTIGGVTTGDITYSATAAVMAANIQKALNAVLGAGVTAVQVVTDGATDSLRVTFVNGNNYDLITASVGTVSATRINASANVSFSNLIAEQQILVVAGTGDFTLSLDGTPTSTITYNATAAAMASAIQTQLNNKFGAGFATVAALNADGTTGTDSFLVTFNDNGQSHSLMTAAGNTVTAVREQQTLAITNTGSNFQITVPGYGATGNIPYNATAATQRGTIETALNTLLGAGSVSVTVVTDGTGQNDTFRVAFTGSKIPTGNLTTSKAGTTTTRTITTMGFNFSYTNNNVFTTLSSAQLSGWHNIIAVGDGAGDNAKTSFYVDGIKVGTAYFKATDDVVSIGNYQGGGQRFSDNIDDVQIYNRALTAYEISSIKSGNTLATTASADAGSLYVFSTDMSNAQVAKLYLKDGMAQDQLGWALDVDIYNVGGTRQSGVIAASSLNSDIANTNGGAVFVWRSTSLQSGAQNLGGLGSGTWALEATLVAYDATAGGYFGGDVAVDVDESSTNARILVGAQFDASNGAYAGAVYDFKYQGGVWLPEKFVSTSPQGGSVGTASFFGNAVDVAGTRAVIGSRYRDTGGQINDGAVYAVELLTQGNYSTVSSAFVASSSSMTMMARTFSVDTSDTEGTVTIDDFGNMVYTPGDAFSSLAYGESAEDSFVYYTESGGLTYANRVNVTVLGQRDVSSAAVDDVLYVSAAEASTLDVLANDKSLDGLTIISLQASGLLGAISSDGSALRYDPNGLFDYLRAGESVQQVFSYTAQDAAGNEVTGKVTLVVVGIDDPVIAQSDHAEVLADGQVTINVLANDSDRDGANTFAIVALDSSAMTGQVFYAADGTVSYVPGEAFSRLPAGQVIEEHLVYILRDSTGNEASGMLTIKITGVYAGTDAGVLPVAMSDVAVTRGVEAVSIPVSANDDGGVIESINVDGATGSVSLMSNGELLYTPGESMASLPAGKVFVDSFSYSIRYADGRASTATVRVHVNGVYATPFVYVAPQPVVDAAEGDEKESEFITSTYLPALSTSSPSNTVDVDNTADSAADTAPIDAVARMALDGMLEMAEFETGQDTAPEVTDDASLVYDDIELPVGKPAFAAMLGRERALHKADMTALLRSLA